MQKSVVMQQREFITHFTPVCIPAEIIESSQATWISIISSH